jgi:hypothetical protein
VTTFGRVVTRGTSGTLIFAKTFSTRKLMRDGLFQLSKDLLNIPSRCLMENKLTFYLYLVADMQWRVPGITPEE